eukprot:537468_1
MAERNEAQHLVYSDHYAHQAAHDEHDHMKEIIIDRFGGDASEEDDDSGFTGMAQYVMDSSDDMKSKTKKLVIPVFVAIGIAAGVMIVTGLIGGFIGGIISMLACCYDLGWCFPWHVWNLSMGNTGRWYCQI